MQECELVAESDHDNAIGLGDLTADLGQILSAAYRDKSTRIGTYKCYGYRAKFTVMGGMYAGYKMLDESSLRVWDFLGILGVVGTVALWVLYRWLLAT